jgi:hypothetical protein
MFPTILVSHRVRLLLFVATLLVVALLALVTVMHTGVSAHHGTALKCLVGGHCGDVVN